MTVTVIKSFRRLLVLFCLAFTAPLIRAASPLDLYPVLMDTLVAGDYGGADAICRRIEEEHSGHPASIYARACVIYAHLTDFEDTLNQGRLFALCDSCIDLCEQLKRHDGPDKAILAYLRGSAMASKALVMHREGGTLSGLRLLMKARGEFQEAIDADPRFYDAYLGRGAYRYGAAKSASLVSWLPIVPSAKSGWKDMWLAVDSSQFSKYFALTSLVWFALKEDDHALTDSICRVGLNRFPNCRRFLWPQLSLLLKQEQWEAAEQVALNLLKQYLTHPDNNGYQTIKLYCSLVTCADSLNRPDDAIEYAREGLATYRRDDVAARRRDKLEWLGKRLEQAETVDHSDD